MRRDYVLGWEREKYRLRRELTSRVDEWVDSGGLDDRKAQDYYASIDDYLENVDEGEDLAVGMDRMPSGANSPEGSDDGRSTYFTDLAGELDELGRQAAGHDWFKDNPHWTYELHDDKKASEYLTLGQ